MRKVVQIKIGDIELEAMLNDSRTADAIWEVLPLKTRFNTWGDEIYFSIPVGIELENGQELVEVGDLGYWPQGNGFCIFFGPTPMSRGEEVRPSGKRGHCFWQYNRGFCSTQESWHWCGNCHRKKDRLVSFIGRV